MTGKFWTWSSKDRRGFSDEAYGLGDIVPIPVECISFKGLSSKGGTTHRKVRWRSQQTV